MYYQDWITAIAALLEYDAELVDATSAAPFSITALNNILPRCVEYVENRMQRDIDFLATEVTNNTGVMIPNSRQILIPTTAVPLTSSLPYLIGEPVLPGVVVTTTVNSNIANVYWPGYDLTVGEQMSFLNPLSVGGLTIGGVYTLISIVDDNNFTINTTFNATISDQKMVLSPSGIYIVVRQIRPIVNGVKQPPLEWVTRDYLDFVWPDDTSPGANIVPQQVCQVDSATLLVGPAPDQAYGFEIVGTQRFPQLSALNTSNFLTINLPDLYIALTGVFMMAYQRDFGASSEDPATGLSYESQYQLLLKSAVVEEARKRFSDMSPSPSNPVSVKSQ